MKNWALLLDLDGTLLDIAATPSDVIVPAGLIDDLEAAAALLDGALAIVSGRALADIDRLMAPLELPAAGEHGAIIRFSGGRREELATNFPTDWFAQVAAAFGHVEGIAIERKAHGVAIHYRQVPDEAERARDLARALAEREPDRFEVLPARMAVEVRSRAANKGHAVARLMDAAPFRGRTPVFVGDDLTDEDGVRAAQALGGFGLRVHEAFAGEPARVRQWLRELVTTGRGAPA